MRNRIRKPLHRYWRSSISGIFILHVRAYSWLCTSIKFFCLTALTDFKRNTWITTKYSFSYEETTWSFSLCVKDLSFVSISWKTVYQEINFKCQKSQFCDTGVTHFIGKLLSVKCSCYFKLRIERSIKFMSWASVEIGPLFPPWLTNLL